MLTLPLGARSLRALSSAALVAALGGMVPVAGAAKPGPTPFTLTATVSFTRLPMSLLPTIAQAYSRDHEIVREMVRDSRHYRIDITTVEPAIDAGTLTVIRWGRSIVSYDSRTGTAARSALPTRTSVLVRRLFNRYLLSFILVPAGIGLPLLLPDASGERGVLTAMRQLILYRYPPEYPPSYVRLARRDVMLGRPVDVIDYGPLLESDQVTGCSFAHPGHCAHHYSTLGTGRMWIEQNSGLVLRSRQTGFTDPHGFNSGNPIFRATALTLGHGPSAADLRLSGVTPVSTPLGGALGGSTTSGNGLNVSRPFLALPIPNVPRLTVSEGMEETMSPGGGVASLTILFSGGRYRVTQTNPQLGFGGERYVTGAYMLVRERLQRRGLPAGLQTGTPVQAGVCPAWTGQYAHRQSWIAFGRGELATQIVSNALSQHQLVVYVARHACSGAGPGQ